jgi:hypothetical protein
MVIPFGPIFFISISLNTVDNTVCDYLSGPTINRWKIL